MLHPSAGGSATITPKGNGSYVRNSNGVYTAIQTSSSSDCYVVFMGGASDFSAQWLGGNTQVKTTLTGGTNGYMHNVRFYRLEDEDDFLAGNIFRKPFKQQLVSLNPGAIRFMNWTGGNTDFSCRWEYRNPPSMGTYSGSFGCGPAYADSTLPTPNIITVAGVSTINGRPATTTSMVHGEVATFRIGAALTRANNGFATVTAITNANPAVASCTAHGFLVNDWVIHQTSGGMPNLNLFPVQITAVTTNTYSFANPSGFGTFSSGSVAPYISLQVGSGSDRTNYPLLFVNGAFAATFGGAGSSFIAQHSTKTFRFDKNVIGVFNGSGTPLYGAWLMNDTNGVDFAAMSGVPIEICVAMVNEINALSVAQGITNPINIWLNRPYAGLLSIDPDYSAGSNWAIKMIDTALNGTTVNSVTYAGLTAAAGIILEYNNEPWNGGPTSFGSSWMTFYTRSRWYASSPSGAGSFKDCNALRATCMSRDVKAAFSGNTRIKTVLGLQLASGFVANDFNGNYYTYYDNSSTPGDPGWYYSHDSVVTGGSWGSCGSNIDAAVAQHIL